MKPLAKLGIEAGRVGVMTLMDLMNLRQQKEEKLGCTIVATTAGQ